MLTSVLSDETAHLFKPERSSRAQQTMFWSTGLTVSLWETSMPYSSPALSTPELCCQFWTSLEGQTQKLQSPGSSHESSWTPPVGYSSTQSRRAWISWRKTHFGRQGRAKRAALYLSWPLTCVHGRCQVWPWLCLPSCQQANEERDSGTQLWLSRQWQQRVR